MLTLNFLQDEIPTIMNFTGNKYRASAIFSNSNPFTLLPSWNFLANWKNAKSQFAWTANQFQERQDNAGSKPEYKTFLSKTPENFEFWRSKQIQKRYSTKFPASAGSKPQPWNAALIGAKQKHWIDSCIEGITSVSHSVVGRNSWLGRFAG